MNKKVIRLENNKEYFQINEIQDNGFIYLLVMNVDDESDVKIVKKVIDGAESYFVGVEEGETLTDLKNKFKILVEEEKKNLQ